MSERKPKGQSWTSWVDQQVLSARERGEFDNLPGKGKPIEGLEKRDPDWWTRQLMEREGLSFLPPTLQIRRDVEEFLEKLPRLPSEKAVLLAVKGINKKIREANSGNIRGPQSTLAPLELAEVVTRWRKVRS